MNERRNGQFNRITYRPVEEICTPVSTLYTLLQFQIIFSYSDSPEKTLYFHVGTCRSLRSEGVHDLKWPHISVRCNFSFVLFPFTEFTDATNVRESRWWH